MNEGATTWALVVGIDAYRDRSIPNLSGAVHDAIDVVTWLRRIGVPDTQILLHASATAASEQALESLCLPFGGCTSEDIWNSFAALEKQSGTRLFVFLSGHGLYEPLGARVFLTEEATDRVWSNLDIEWHTRFLRGQDFRRQFVFMDGCLNQPYTASERARFEPGHKSAVTLPPPRTDVEQWFCYGAAVGERALEHPDGYGLFLHTLLQVLDPDDPHPNCLDIDETTGTYQLDLHRAIVDVIVPTVAREASTHRRRQNPGIQMLSAGVGARRVPVVRIHPSESFRLCVTVEPAAAVSDLTQLDLWSRNTIWQRRLPAPGASGIDLPYEVRLPIGTKVTVVGQVRPNGAWEPPGLHELTIERDWNLILEVTARTESDDAVAVRLLGPDGQPIESVIAPIHAEVEQVLDRTGGQGISFDLHETGPQLRGFTDDREGAALAWRIAEAIEEATPNVAVAVQGAHFGTVITAVRPGLRPSAARRLAGPLMDEPVIRVMDVVFSPNDVVARPLVAVDPGPVTIRVDLPWGTWSSRILVRPGTVTPVELPRSVGVPPLRIRQFTAADPEERPMARTVVGVGRAEVHGTVWAAGKLVGELSPLSRSPRQWRGRWSGTDAAVTPWTALAEIVINRRRMRFPLSETGPVAVLWGTVPQAEPLEGTRDPMWDRVMLSAQSTAMSQIEAEHPTPDWRSSPLPALAAAYTCLAQGRFVQLAEMLESFRGSADTDPTGMPVDVDILAAAIEHLPAFATAPRLSVGIESFEALVRAQMSGAVPVIRWGVTIGIDVAHTFGLHHLEQRWRRIDAELVSSSVWTLWRT